MVYSSIGPSITSRIFNTSLRMTVATMRWAFATSRVLLVMDVIIKRGREHTMEAFREPNHAALEKLQWFQRFEFF